MTEKRAVTKITHREDGTVEILDLTNGRLSTLERGYSSTQYIVFSSGCVVMILIPIITIIGLFLVL